MTVFAVVTAKGAGWDHAGDIRDQAHWIEHRLAKLAMAWRLGGVMKRARGCRVRSVCCRR